MIRVNYSRNITQKHSSSHKTRKYRHIFARVAAFWQRVFQTSSILDAHPGLTIHNTLTIFSIINVKDFIMQRTTSQVYTSIMNTLFCHRKINPITFERDVHVYAAPGVDVLTKSTYIHLTFYRVPLIDGNVLSDFYFRRRNQWILIQIDINVYSALQYFLHANCEGVLKLHTHTHTYIYIYVVNIET